jgi:hypothetical protein
VAAGSFGPLLSLVVGEEGAALELHRRLLTFMFMTAWVFEARPCPTLPNEIKKTKL